MSKNDGTLRPDPWFTDTRMTSCYATNCYYNDSSRGCALKKIAIEVDGKCISFKDKTKKSNA